jgi:hypothetical protein
MFQSSILCGNSLIFDLSLVFLQKKKRNFLSIFDRVYLHIPTWSIRILSTFDVRYGAKVRPTASCVSAANVCRCSDILILLADNIKSVNNARNIT